MSACPDHEYFTEGCPQCMRLVTDMPTCTPEEGLLNYTMTLEMVGQLKLPPSWSKECNPFPLGDPRSMQQRFIKGNARDGIRVIADMFLFDDKIWQHVSLSRAKRMPTYEDMVEVKKVFVGEDRQAVQIFPAKSKHVNLHPFCLHLWAAVAPYADGLPNFGKYGTI